MNIGLKFREQVGQIGGFLVEELDQLVAGIRGGWLVEHKADGSHGDIHADSVTTDDLTVVNVDVTGHVSSLDFGDDDLGTIALDGSSVTGRQDISSYPTVSTTADVITPVLASERSFCPTADASVSLGLLSDVSANTRRWKNLLFSHVAYGPTIVATTAFYERGRSVALGEWTTPTYSAGDFTASAGSWGVDSGDITTYSYTLIGKTMTVNFVIDGTDVSTAAPTNLRIKIPGGFTANKTVIASAQVSDAGGAFQAGICRVASGGTVIEVYKDNTGSALWTLTAGDNTSVRGSITFEVQ
jgi:hypothetical protein